MSQDTKAVAAVTIAVFLRKSLLFILGN